MRIEDVKVGMKVKLIDKTQGYGGLDNSTIYRRMLENKQDYAYVVRIERLKNRIIINDKPYVSSGDFFSYNDLVPDIKRERKEKLEKICSSQEIKLS